MPWLETSPVEQRERFIRDHRLELYAMTELSARYGISRKTGYKWLARYDEGGRAGLRDRSRAPQHCPHRIPRDVAAMICAARRQHPSWGPAKLLAWLRPRQPGVEWPAISTAGDLLARRGLVKKRRRRRHYQHPGVVPPLTTQPNDLWTADFKGHFRTRDGIYCYPLTIADQHTRYLLACLYREPLADGAPNGHRLPTRQCRGEPRRFWSSARLFRLLSTLFGHRRVALLVAAGVGRAFADVPARLRG